MKEEFEFDNQRSDEEVLLLKHRHPWVLARACIYLVFLVVAIIIAFLIFGASRYSIIITAIILVLIFIYVLNIWFVYLNTTCIVTNQRVIYIDQATFFTRRLSEAELENVQNITTEVRGPVRNLLDFGNVIVSTAGNSPSLTIVDIEDPQGVHEKIVEGQKKIEDKWHDEGAGTVIR